MNKEYYSKRLSHIYEHIMLNCTQSDEFSWMDKGYIIVDDQSDELLNFVKTNLRYNMLQSAGKVHEITIDESWAPFARTDKEMGARDYWKTLVTAADKVANGLLVINIRNIEIFRNCWYLKQLAKQENKFSTKSGSGSRIDFEFNGYVLLVIKDLSWDNIQQYATEHNAGQFNSMMDFYKRITIV